MDNNNPTKLSTLSETLFIPLSVRANETASPTAVIKAPDIEKLNPKVKLIQSWSTGDFFKKRQPLMLRLLNFLPSTRNRSQILHLQLR